MSESRVNGSLEQQHAVELKLVPEQRLLSGGEFQPPSPAFLRAIAAESDESKQAVETALYALELCGVIDRRADLEGDTRIVRADLQDFFKQYNAKTHTDAEITAERLRIQQQLEVIERSASINETVSKQLYAALDFDARHTAEQREEVSELLRSFSLNDAPCLEEIIAMQSVQREGRPIIAERVTASARRALEMVLLTDAKDKELLFPQLGSSEQTPEAA